MIHNFTMNQKVHGLQKLISLKMINQKRMKRFHLNKKILKIFVKVLSVPQRKIMIQFIASL